MARKRETLVDIKKWINPDSTAFVRAKLTRASGGYLDGSLKMADCSRICEFDVWVEDKKDRKATLKKLNIMIDTIQQLANEIERIDDD